MRQKHLIVSLLLSLTGNGVCAWASEPGTTGANILNLGVGARAIGLGEAYTALADDSSSLFWNPGGVALLTQSEASFMYNQYVNDLNYQHMAVATPLESGGLGASLSYLSFGKIEGMDNTGAPTGDVNAYSAVATLGGAWLGDIWSLGFNLKGVQGSLADVKATTAAGDLGGTVIYPDEILGGTFRFGATVRNLGPGIKYLQQSDPLPTQWRLGAAALEMLNKKLNLSMDVGKTRDEDGAVYGGAEYWVTPHIALRTGYAGTHAEGSGLRAGVGLRLKALSFDYAYAGYGDLGLAHRYELSYRFGYIRPLLTPEERRLLRRARIAIREERFAEAVLLLNSLITLEPHYRLFQRLMKVAMVGNEGQERWAQQHNNYSFQNNSKTAARATLSDLDDLEQLLKETEPGAATARQIRKPVMQAPDSGRFGGGEQP